MLILALDTSGALVTVALHDGSAVLAERSTPDARHHAELLAPSIAEVLASAGAQPGDLTDIVVGVGPGPFTGLRVGLVTARVLGHTLGVPVHGVCSLDALAQAVAEGAGRGGTPAAGAEFLIATDARRREVYWARYRRADGPPAVRVEGPQVGAPGTLPVTGQGAALPVTGRGAALPVAGRGAALYPEVLGPALEPLDVTAAQVAALAARLLTGPGSGGGLLPPDPLYLRRPDAAEAGVRKRVSGPAAGR